MAILQPQAASSFRSRLLVAAAIFTTVILLLVALPAPGTSQGTVAHHRLPSWKPWSSHDKSKEVEKSKGYTEPGTESHEQAAPDTSIDASLYASGAVASPSSVEPVYPADYAADPRQDWCEDRYSTRWLDAYASNHTEFCSSGASNLQCFSRKRSREPDSDSDYFCVADGVVTTHNAADPHRRFQLSCDMTPSKKAELKSFPEYMFWTGVRKILDDFFVISPEKLIAQNVQSLQCGSKDKRRSKRSTAILFKRDGGGNMWHSLMEVMNYYLSMDALSLAKDAEGNPYFVESEDSEDLQVIWVDPAKPGQYGDMWSLFSSKPSISLGNLPLETACFDRVIIPLPGAINPMWEGDWRPYGCTDSALLESFRRRILRQTEVEMPVAQGRPHDADTTVKQMVITMIDRRKTRSLVHQDLYLDLLRTKYPRMVFQTLDLQTTTFKEQVAMLSTTDVLVGTHGAGLTGQIFMPGRGSVVELLPQGFMHKGFRNLAQLRAHKYYSLHAVKLPDDAKGWRTPPIRIDEARFMGVMDLAIKSVSNQGMRSEDAY